MAKNIMLTVESEAERLDSYLHKKNSEYSRGYFQRLIKSGQVTVNGKIKNVAHYILKKDDSIQITFNDESKNIKAENVELDIIYEDEDLLIVNKAPGVVVHPACGHYSGTLLNALAGYAKDKFTPLLVHRLDKDTSGIIVTAKNERAKNSMVKQFQNRTISKIYLAAVQGIINENKGYIEAPLGRSPDDRKKIVVGPLATKMAITEFSVVKRCDNFTLLEVHPITGRTHQIRSHMTYIGHPVLGDHFYGGLPSIGELHFKRQMLHAYKIAFSHPSTGHHVKFTASIPSDMADLWNSIL